MYSQNSPSIRKALKTFEDHGGTLRTHQALKLGIHPRTLYKLRDAGLLEELQRGLYCLPGQPRQSYPDLVTISRKIPQGILCLISALFFHHLTTQIPHKIHLAVKQGYKPPPLSHPPVHYYWLSLSYYKLGIETHRLDGTTVRVYSKEKTIIDCFRFRNQIGIDIAIEALKKYWQQGHPNITLLLRFAKQCRVERILKPYLAMLLDESA